MEHAMFPRCLSTTIGVLVLAGYILAQDGGPSRGKITKLDAESKSITLKVGDKEQTFRVVESTRLPDARGDSLAEKLRSYKIGAAVMFKAAKQDGHDVLVGLKLTDDKKPAAKGERVSGDTSKLMALPELGTGKYQGFEGGLYPGGKNERPKEHEAAGLRLAKEVTPRGGDGQPSPIGKIVLLSIGMSNTSQASTGFAKQLGAFADKNPRVLFVNGAVGGQTAAAIQDPDDNGRGTRYWAVVDQRLTEADATRAQVQAVWIKQADAGPSEGFPAYAKKLQGELANIGQILPKRFPNVKLCYLSSRTYGGYATTKLNPEPYAYESGFSVKWLIEQQLKGDAALNYDPARGQVTAPWLSWGPYLWANGAKKNADGLFYDVGDFGTDGTHHSGAGVDKQGRQLLEFFRSDTTTRGWFTRQ
jgi:hypothetical protein